MIWFVGAGPGDPELITVKGRRLLEEADVVVYAGSLVPRAVLGWTREGCELHDSAGMTLGEQVAVMAAGEAAGKNVVRLHTGDPSIYGAIGEQMRALDARGLAYGVVPGVSSFVASAAALPAELTSPGISQTVIITRQAGRTPVPDGQDVAGLAAHGATMAIFLSAGDLDGTVADLCTHYPRDTAAAIVQRASWPEQVVLRGTLETIARQAREAGVDRTAMILVGNTLRNEGDPSLLYDAGFTHGYRRAEKPGGLVAGTDVDAGGADPSAASPAGAAE
jgi:precorrin-4/cobalt-precorrin-4 C11-methyltransferase